MSEVFPFASASATSTGAFDVEPQYTRRTPDASRYFCVGQAKE
jgi:hypothetical protein